MRSQLDHTAPPVSCIALEGRLCARIFRLAERVRRNCEALNEACETPCMAKVRKQPLKPLRLGAKPKSRRPNVAHCPLAYLDRYRRRALKPIFSGAIATGNPLINPRNTKPAKTAG